ncbi:MAG: protein-glutamate O-methyltransferase CheR [Dehalococcoidia bacterium]|nr:MAG: protein-glutamate O-methyltransferase CheR [Dehalococcoidia bacterium]
MESTATEHEAAVIDVLLEKVYRDGGYDFRDYKRGTVVRRLERRLHVTGAKTYLDYMQFLDAHPEEYQKFAEYLTIKVSNFFRSPYTFQQVAGLVLPELVSYKKSRGERSLKFWSTACARGEEPYSIAILLAEFLGRQRRGFDISIYATDISREALQEVQAGRYSLKDVEGIPGSILESYFTRHGENCELKADIRQMVNFSSFDLTSVMHQSLFDLDCIFCCNVLIYFQRRLQEKVLDMLYDSLATPGYLILGEVEMLTGNMHQKLECLDSKAKIYKKVRTSN